MIFRKQIGWLVAWAYVLAGVRARICRRVRREGLIVPVSLHAPAPERLEAILRELDRLVGLERIEVSFDDGRRVLRRCLPILEKFKVKSIWFISPGEILKGYNWAERAKTCPALDFGRMCRASASEREEMLRAVGADGAGDALLTVSDVRELAHHPLVEFGNHTWSHMSCACRPPDEAMDEVERSQKQIAAWTGREPTAFAYPFGHDSPELDALIRERGLVPYALRPGLVTAATRGRARNMAYESLTFAEDVGRLLTAWPRVRRMPV